ncbi:MAG: 3-hydroxybutyryl-CoA dehydrogenase [Tissierellia bacterium]|nr:3-hydroxybutyryl-CoA dehydrogenase [Bacillota bacterium]NLL22966.1 3-hydroxybutyryl-CoA dehydrogenase [Tissierellia bacterium]
MKVGVIGSGTMGAGIAQILAQQGHEVVLNARRQTSVDGGIANIDRQLTRLVQRERMTQEDKDAVMARVSGTTVLEELKDVDLIIEAAAEEIESKKTLFKRLDEMLREDVIIATNTSSLSITEIASATSRPDKVIGMHFFNPVPVMKLVEVINGVGTSKETEEFVINLSKELGKTPVLVEEAPGFVVNRILVPMINEAVGILAEGIASAEDIDEAMKLGANHPIGPLALGDLIGNDVVLNIMDVLYGEFGDSKYRAHPLLRKMVRGGKLGRKTKQGFFDY